MTSLLKSGKLRLVDGLVLAAGALLVMKTLSLIASPADDLAPDGLPRFAHIFAYARSNHIPADPATTGSVPDAPKKDAPAPTAGDAPAAAPPPKTMSPAEKAIYERLGERREELQKRARDLETREKMIEDEERRLDTKRSETGRAGDQDAAAGKPAEADPALKGLVIMYETMKPKEAARVFDRLSHEVLVPVVRLIAPRKMAEILAAMTPENAEKLTMALARRARPESASAAGSGLPAGELPSIDLPARPPTKVRP